MTKDNSAPGEGGTDGRLSSEELTALLDSGDQDALFEGIPLGEDLDGITDDVADGIDAVVATPVGALDRVIRKLEENMVFVLHTDISHPDELYNEVLDYVDRYSHQALLLKRDGLMDEDIYYGLLSRMLENIVIPLAEKHCDISTESVDSAVWSVIDDEFVQPGFAVSNVLTPLKDGNLADFVAAEPGSRFLPRILTLMNHMISDKAHDMIAKIGDKDPLTGLKNRRAAESDFSDILARMRRAKHSEGGTWGVAVLIFDIDHFKLFNDEFNHTVGDRVLQSVAQITESTLREGTDLVARWGGEEFVVILPNTHANGAVNVANKIRTAIEEKAVELAKEQYPEDTAILPAERQVTITVGVSHSSLKDVSPKLADAVKPADEVLVATKEADKRNSVATTFDLTV